MKKVRASYHSARIDRIISCCLVAIAIGAIAFIRLRLLNIPLDRDEGEYAYAAQLILKGVPPYISAYSMKFSGIYYIYAMIMSIFGATTEGIRSGLIITNTLTVVLIFFLGKRLLNLRAAVVSAMSYAFLSLSATVLGLAANIEHFVVFFMIAGLYCLLRAVDYRNRSLFFLSGVTFGIGVVIRQHALLFIIFAVTYLISSRQYEKAKNLKAQFKNISIFLLGCLLPIICMAAAIYNSGVFDKFIFWNFKYAYEYSTLFLRLPFLTNVLYCSRQVLNVIMPNFGLWFIGLSAIAVTKNKKIRQDTGTFLTWLFIFSLLSVLPGMYLFNHYFIMMLPAVSLLVGLAFRFISEKYNTVVAIIVITASLLQPLLSEKDLFFKKDKIQASRAIYGLNPFPEAVRVAEYIKEHSDKEDSVAVLGSEPEIYFYLNRVGATKYIYMYPMMEEQSYLFPMREEFMNEIERAEPDYIVFVNIGASWFTYSLKEAIRKPFFDWWYKYENERYDIFGIVDMVSRDDVRYVWGDQASLYSPSSPKNFHIRILKKKCGIKKRDGR